MLRRRRISKVEDVHKRAVQLAKDLQVAREQGKITPSRSENGRSIAKKMNKFYGWNLSSDAGVRELVNHARSIGLPIGGDGKGYYYAVDSAELMPTIRDLKSRIAAISQALNGVEKTARIMEQLEANLFRQGERDGNRISLQKNSDPKDAETMPRENKAPGESGGA